MSRALLASPLGLLVGLSIGVLGSGGSILAVPILVHAAGQTPQDATATSLMLVSVAALSGLPAHYRAGRVRPATGIAFGLSALSDSAAQGERPRWGMGRVLAIVAAGTGIGFLTGLFGVGGGFVIVPALTLLLGFAMPQAIGTSMLVVAINASTALAMRIGTAHIEWDVAVAFTITAVAGTLAGGRIAGSIDAERSLRLFAGVLVLLALYTGGTAIAAMR